MFWISSVVVYFLTAQTAAQRGASWSIIAPPFRATNDGTTVGKAVADYILSHALLSVNGQRLGQLGGRD
jgi:hypothetical protein